MTGTTKMAEKAGQNFEDSAWVDKLAAVIDEFRKVNPDITANQMLVLLRIGEHPGITQNKVSEKTDLADGTVSRICALMSERGHQGRKGLGVIEIRDVPGDYRSKGQYLVGNGKKMYASIKRHLNG